MMMSKIPANMRKKLNTAARATNVLPGMNERDDAGAYEGDREHHVEQLPPAVGEHHPPDLEHACCDGDDAEQDRDRADGRVVEAEQIAPTSVQPMPVIRNNHHGGNARASVRRAAIVVIMRSSFRSFCWLVAMLSHSGP